MFLPIVNIPIDAGPTEPVAVVYPTETTSWDTTLGRMIEELANSRLPPSRILLICLDGTHQRIASAFRANRDHLVDRLRATTHVAVAPYDCHGQIKESEVIDLRRDDAIWVTDDLAKTAASCYLAQLTRATNAVLDAPPGYRFRKLSGNTSDIFLRAGNMARELDSLNVISHMLLRHWPYSAKTIYIDSFTILSYALGLQKTISHFCAKVPTIENFHSYDKNDSLMFPPDGDYLVVISASTSGGLEKKLVGLHGADRRRIFHIIGAGNRGTVSSAFRDSCMHFLYLDSPSSESPGDIVIKGEEFIPSYSEPSTVRLTKAHVSRQIASRYTADFYQRYLRLQYSASSGGYGGHSLFSTENKSRALDSEKLRDWLVGRLIHEIPASVSLVVHLNDGMSCSLARLISEGSGTLADKTCLPLGELSSFEKSELGRDTAVLVIAYEDPNLEQFTAASTILRKWPEAHRHFVLAYGFPETKAGFDAMKASLIRGHRPFYGWSEFSVSAVGRLDRHLYSFDNYPVDLIESLVGFEDIEEGLLKALQQHADCSRRLFLPKLNGERLTLRPSSVFFDDEYAHLSDEVIYLAVAVAVQYAREADGLDPDKRFDSNPFVGSVIDPQMFSRFSDGVLQAALLRCLHPSELDFSGSTLLSRQVREVLVAVVSNPSNVVGEAALEFMAALAVDKIKLNEEDKQFVLDTIEESSAGLDRVWKLFVAERPF